jgi:hypothetical protein
VRAVILSLLLLAGAAFAQEAPASRFLAVDVFLDSPMPVAAWQFELTETRGMMQVVGIENGESTVYGDAPYYDREAVRLGTADRIVVADFSLADEDQLPSGRIRVATVHVMLSGEAQPDFEVTLVTANSFGGQTIGAAISLDAPNGREQ